MELIKISLKSVLARLGRSQLYHFSSVRFLKYCPFLLLLASSEGSVGGHIAHRGGGHRGVGGGLNQGLQHRFINNVSMEAGHGHDHVGR